VKIVIVGYLRYHLSVQTDHRNFIIEDALSLYLVTKAMITKGIKMVAKTVATATADSC